MCGNTFDCPFLLLIWKKKNLHLKTKRRKSRCCPLSLSIGWAEWKDQPLSRVLGDCSGFGFTTKFSFHAGSREVIITGLCCCFHFFFHPILSLLIQFSFVFGSFTSLVAWIQIEVSLVFLFSLWSGRRLTTCILFKFNAWQPNSSYCWMAFRAKDELPQAV